MDVLKPRLLITRGFRFRVNRSAEPQGASYEHDEVENIDDFYSKEDLDLDENNGNYDVEVKQVYDGKYEARVPVPSVMLGSVVGKKGVTKQRIEKETQCQLRVPKPGAEGDVVITSSEKSNVLAAGRRLLMLVETSRHKLKFTHFVSLPLSGSEALFSRVLDFQEAVRKCYLPEKIDERLFLNMRKMHLTVLVLTLLDDRERQLAMDLLHECFSKKIRPMLADENGIRVRLKGLEIMNDDWSQVQVVYAKLEPTLDSLGRDVIQEMADAIQNHFEGSGLAPESRCAHVKLHFSVMNSKKLAKEMTTQQDSSWKPRLNDMKLFDAKPIYENLLDFDFGEVLISHIHLSILHTVGEDGYYRPSLTVPIKP
ncbi:unnamed protein product [Notodromas monacha]|uniref:K Homology domain-containing protein n=1 Tax=Notodromas monacha TaxID=399045 RepID=A0A7R9BTI8_9CRUS|nr:unnamed protein product [Notodromas monacha]CAG0921473.1 unnamed protein product [Notodromas monacha]